MKKSKNVLLLFVFAFALVGCSSFKKKLLPNNNKGGYILTFVKPASKSKMNKVVTIRGHVYDLETNLPLGGAKVSYGCLILTTLADGGYSFKTRNSRDDSFFVEADKEGLLSIETNSIDSYGNKEIIIDFYLDKNNSFLLDCKGSRIIEETPEE
ncbi:hypothetical protein [Flavobacterium poyangense]|uniref:hypothetical protein n=1 Tax=Flavobacterium poyangense TaxID=2204302 RepID=UPI00141D75FE|nr:hypothetical protein [Flavobacterium sp. JXAS1]